MNNVLLEIKNLNLSFDHEQNVVENVSLQISKGETVAIVGESGSGKSVTALSTVNLLPENAKLTGSIIYKNKQLLGASESILQKVRGNDISFIFQEPMTSLNPLHTLEKQILESLSTNLWIKILLMLWRKTLQVLQKYLERSTILKTPMDIIILVSHFVIIRQLKNYQIT